MPKVPLGSRPLDRLRSRLGIFRGGPIGFLSAGSESPRPDAGPIERSFYGHAGRVAHKWHHYLPLYDRYFASFRDRPEPVRMLEIGVAEGGSLELWRTFFGDSATIFGIDKNSACAAFDGERGNRVRIGSQNDPHFLRSVVAEMGGLDIVLDDGSHVAAHIGASFDTLFPLLSEGGLYVIEDLHTSYWRNFGGNFFSSKTAIGLAKTLIDDMHHWYHPHGQAIVAGRDWVGGLHMHDSLMVIEKQDRSKPPQMSFRGKATGNS